MLRQVVLENFKGLKKAQIDFGRITVLIGPNGTGKSSIWQALMVLRQSVGLDHLEPDGSCIGLGAFDNVLHKEAQNREIKIGVSVDVGPVPLLRIPEGALFSYHACFRPKVTGFDATIASGENTKHFAARLLSGQKAPGAVEPSRFVLEDAVDGKSHVIFSATRTVASPISIGDLSLPGKSADEQETLKQDINELLSAIQHVLSKTYYVPAIRGFTNPEYPLGDQPAKDFGPGAGAVLATTLAYSDEEVKRVVSNWSKDITGSGLSSPVIPGRKVVVKSDAARGGIPIIGEGFGTNQLVQLLLTLAISPAQSVIAIEEPEIHLHPKAQRKLCEMLVSEAKSREIQLIITTHSEHVLAEFVSAVRRGDLSRDDLSLYCFEEKGEEPRQIEQDESGDIYDWSRNFFRWS